MSTPDIADVLIVGAGVAGLSAAVALGSAGARVTLLERKPYVGGRAYSYPHPALNQVIDSQHVLLGCCTNLIDLCRLSGADKHIRWYDRIPFLEPARDGEPARVSEIGPEDLPAPAHSMLSFLGAPMLGPGDKVRIARGLMQFMRGVPQEDDEPFSDWLKRTRQSERSIRHFWEPIVVSTLNDTFERCSTKYAAQVFYESLLKSAEGGRFGIPARPLSDFYDSVATLAQTHGTDLRLRCSVDRIAYQTDGTLSVTTSDGARFSAKALLLALPFEQTAKLLSTFDTPNGQKAQVLANISRFQHAPITTIHLWFDRPVTELEHGALLDTRIQWMFNKSRIRRTVGPEQYLELVISASFQELHQTREQILQPAIEELARFFPQVRSAKLVRSGVLKEARATFSVTPGLDAIRPAADACGNQLFLAGDWTRSGWPSTMEGAVRSGRLAAEAIAASAGQKTTFVTPDLPASGVMRLFARK